VRIELIELIDVPLVIHSNILGGLTKLLVFRFLKKVIVSTIKQVDLLVVNGGVHISSAIIASQRFRHVWPSFLRKFTVKDRHTGVDRAKRVPIGRIKSLIDACTVKNVDGMLDVPAIELKWIATIDEHKTAGELLVRE